MIDDSYYDSDPVFKRKTYTRPTILRPKQLTGKKYCHASETSFNKDGRYRYFILKDQYRILPRNSKGKTALHFFVLDNVKHVVILRKEVNALLISSLKENTTGKRYNALKQKILIEHLHKNIKIINRYGGNYQFSGTLSEVLNKVLALRGITKSHFLREVVQIIIDM